MASDGKCALITGAGSGIGRALAIEAAERGMRLLLTGRREAALAETRAATGAPARVHITPADITEASDRARLRMRAAELFGRLDLLVNNAGAQAVGSLAATDDGALEALTRTNLLAPMALTRELLGLLGAAAPSRIVNVGSMFGDIAFPHFAAYSATKFGLRGFSDALRRELRDSGIGVTYAAPRATRTPAMQGWAHLVEPFAMKLDDPDRVARAILGAAERGARTVYPRGPERVFILVQHLVPSAIDRSLAGMLRRARAVAGKAPAP